MQKICAFRGVCSRDVCFDIDERHIVRGIAFRGGCNGNLKGIAALCEGMPAEEIIARLRGIRCGSKSTSCPDQFAGALAAALREAAAPSGETTTV